MCSNSTLHSIPLQCMPLCFHRLAATPLHAEEELTWEDIKWLLAPMIDAVRSLFQTSSHSRKNE